MAAKAQAARREAKRTAAKRAGRSTTTPRRTKRTKVRSGTKTSFDRTKVRYAVVGQGYISQVAVLPAFEHARKNSVLAALVSDDPVKRKKLARKYGVEHTYDYEAYEDCLRSGTIDAVFIALPNHMHAEYAVRAARAGIHVLCEKPMAVTEAECRAMIDSAEETQVKLMIAYRLHFEAANLEAIEIIESGKLGEPRIFDSVFTMQVEDPDNIRLRREAGGGTLYDIGIYCINAARYLFRAEPEEVFAWTASGKDDGRFSEVEEMASCMLRFPGDRLATFTASFGAADVSSYRIVGTKGDLVVEPAFEFAGALEHRLTVGERKRKKTFPKRDQFAPELLHFSDCILTDKTPEPSGEEGLADVHIIGALYESARRRAPIRIGELPAVERPRPEQEIRRPAVAKPSLVRAQSPSGAR